MEKLIRPLNIDNFIVSSGFWDRRGIKYHLASDYPVGIGTPLYASNSGYLYDSTTSKCGNGVMIVGTENSPYITSYCHLEKFAPDIENDLNRNGQAEVKQGQLIGYTGNSGNTTGPHLHFKVRSKTTGLPINPESLDYRKYNYAGINWVSIIFGSISVLALIMAFRDEKKKATK